MHRLLFFTLLLYPLIDFAQKPVELTIGDTLVIGECKSGEFFTHMDLYRKTRMEDTLSGYDTSGGSNFYEWFFLKGDFDASRLPCSYGKRKVVLASARQFILKEGQQPVMVLLAWIDPKKMEVVWIVTDPALESGEITVLKH